MKDNNKRVEYKNNWPIVAICYDFDKTLSPKDMQNYALIPQLGCEIDEFWSESNNLAKRHGMDKILSYMKVIVDKAQATHKRISRENFNELGKTIELFEGVDSWFSRINNIAKEQKINVEHYIISAGLKEIIEGTSIAKAFTEIYASEFVYNEYGQPIWPSQVVNYTTKTQYLFRINKACLDLSDEDSVNSYVADEDRRIPFKHFIYIGDSETDIPAMKIVKQGGGSAIGVYNPISCNLEKVTELLKQERIDFVMPADYSQNGRMEVIVTSILKKIRANFELKSLNATQKTFICDVEKVDEFIEFTKNRIRLIGKDKKELAALEKESKQILLQTKAELIKGYAAQVGKNEINLFIESKLNQLNEMFK